MICEAPPSSFKSSPMGARANLKVIFKQPEYKIAMIELLFQSYEDKHTEVPESVRKYPCKDDAGGPAPEALSANESFCKREEEVSISSSTWKVAILADVLRDDLGLLIVRPATRRADPEMKSSRGYKILKKLGQIAVPLKPNR